MSEDQATPVLVRLSPEQIRRLDDWRRAQPDLPTRPEAIRRLMDRAFVKPLPKPVKVSRPRSMRRVTP
jgi:hypothetical protein